MSAPGIHLARASSHLAARAAIASALGSALAPLRRLAAWRDRQRTVRHLEALHPHLLNDIGIDRSQIELAVDGLLTGTPPAAPRRAPKSGMRRRIVAGSNRGHAVCGA